MFIIAVLFYVLSVIDAPVWCYILTGMAAFFKIVDFGIKLGGIIKTGKDD